MGGILLGREVPETEARLVGSFAGADGQSASAAVAQCRTATRQGPLLVAKRLQRVSTAPRLSSWLKAGNGNRVGDGDGRGRDTARQGKAGGAGGQASEQASQRAGVDVMKASSLLPRSKGVLLPHVQHDLLQ